MKKPELSQAQQDELMQEVRQVFREHNMPRRLQSIHVLLMFVAMFIIAMYFIIL